MKAISTSRCPLRRIVMPLLAGAGVRSVDLDYCRATVRVEGHAMSGMDGSLLAACAQLAGYRRSRLIGAAEAGPGARRVTMEELAYHSAWLRREKGGCSPGGVPGPFCPRP